MSRSRQVSSTRPSPLHTAASSDWELPGLDPALLGQVGTITADSTTPAWTHAAALHTTIRSLLATRHAPFIPLASATMWLCLSTALRSPHWRS
mmetsp:Transcript_23555/g.58981  ORF Transcript_23555/g.58981 Transcript_23555/m.58981 type:complete len:93 (-) Transcript_23555:222-500(-)